MPNEPSQIQMDEWTEIHALPDSWGVAELRLVLEALDAGLLLRLAAGGMDEDAVPGRTKTDELGIQQRRLTAPSRCPRRLLQPAETSRLP